MILANSSKIEKTAIHETLSRESFTELILQHGKFIRNFIAKKCWETQDIEDIYQTTLMEAYKSLKNFRGDSHPRTWVCGIALMVIKTYIRKSMSNNFSVQSLDEIKGENQAHIDLLPDASQKEPDRAYALESLCSDLDSSVKQLPSNLKDVFVSVVYEGNNYQQAADHFGIPVGTVRSRLSRVRGILRDAHAAAI